MCTFNISLDDDLTAQLQSRFIDKGDINLWMQRQVELMALQYITKKESALSGLTEEEQEKEAFLYTSKLHAATMFAKYL